MSDGRENAEAWYEDICEWYRDRNEDHIYETVIEAAQSVEVRSGWVAAGGENCGEPVEFSILLSGGGPALRLQGTLGFCSQPDTAHLRYSWASDTKEWHAPEEPLLWFASMFYYGD